MIEEMKDYYKILQVHPEADLNTMNAAYRALVKQYHPDLYHTRHNRYPHTYMQEINEAYTILSHATTRANYDRQYQQMQFQNNIKKPVSVRSLWVARVKNILLWALGTIIVLKGGWKLLLLIPGGKWIACVFVLVLLVYYSRKRKRSF